MTWCRYAAALALCAIVAQAQPAEEPSSAFGFAVVATPAGLAEDRATATTLRAAAATPASFVVHFETSGPSSLSCGDEALERRRALLDASDKPVVPIPAGSEWADCGGGDGAGTDPFERLQRVDDTLFADAESLGRARLPWVRESSLRRFRRYRENVRWQVGGVLFATMNLPDDNNDFKLAAGRNGEFEDRVVANRAWLERTFRLATERRLAGVVLFVDAQPRFQLSLRPPDLRSPDRDGYYEWKVALREQALAFKGRVLIVQGHGMRGSAPARPADVDHPLRDGAGRPLDRVSRVVARIDDDRSTPTPDAPRWLRIAVDPKGARLFAVSVEQGFDDPSGELYGAPPR